MTLLLVRHTAVAVTPGLCYGRTDVPLAASFAAEATAVRAALPPGPWEVYSSPATRCRRLAETLATHVQLDARLRELDFGTWEGRLWPELSRAATEEWLADFVHRRPPDGESMAELAGRAAACVSEILARPAAAPAVVVTHGGVIGALLALARGQPLASAFSAPPPHGSVHALPAESAARLGAAAVARACAAGEITVAPACPP